ncbi:MAG: ChbG/HpnK family deacetylase [Magnetovibrio sp.]|nr:ChbG/HpnK family deacetylase [Magnetovibrio sp.]
MKPYLHADDIGMSPAVTDNILDAVDNGAVTSVSLVVNGHDSERACAELLARPHVAVSLHLNLSEGLHIADTPRKGEPVNGGFEALFVKNYRGADTTDIELEIEAQMARFVEMYVSKAPEGTQFRIDSHHHTHCIPFVFQTIMKHADQFGLKSIRVPSEPFFFKFSKAYLSLATMVNYIKVFLLQVLSWQMMRVLQKTDIEASRRFIGVTFTGYMAPDNILDGLKSVKNDDESLVEVLLHPGGSHDGERHIWADRPALWSYYSSDGRSSERAVAKSDELKILLEQYS